MVINYANISKQKNNMAERKEKTVVVVGSGGREQGLGFGLGRSPDVKRTVMVPGNPGSHFLGIGHGKTIVNREPAGDDVGEYMKVIRAEKPDLVVVGPELLLVKGLGDMLAEEKIPAIAPTSEVARLEASKVHTRRLATFLGVPQPEYSISNNVKDGLDMLDAYWDWNYRVVKVDGLAGGKGVTVCDTKEELSEAISTARKRFPTAADQILIEERLEGTEVSYIGVTDGTRFVPFVPTMDYKRLLDGDKGPNTGGMGAIAPNPNLTPEIAQEIEQRIVMPFIDHQREIGDPYKGFFYAGVMLTKDGPKLIEINVRNGDPETQVQMTTMSDALDLYKFLRTVTDGTLRDSVQVRKQLFPPNKAAVLIVLAAEGYPDNPKKDFEIWGINAASMLKDITVFHAATKQSRAGAIVANGGRVLNVVGTGKTIDQARSKANLAIESIQDPSHSLIYRTDIGKR